MCHSNFEQARAYALQRLECELPAALTYHSLAHTRDDVAPASLRFAAIAGVSGEQRMLLHTAAYYHDIGFVVQRADHELVGARIAAETLPSFGYSPAQIERIHGMIMATKLPQSPRNLLEQLLADADLDALGRTDFLSRNQALRDELAAYGARWDDLAWAQEQLCFVGSHQYWTDAARQVRGEQKRRNIALIAEMIERFQLQI
jgi:predicted metal-dependent HD superfamily phosphohydrolase